MRIKCYAKWKKTQINKKYNTDKKKKQQQFTINANANDFKGELKAKNNNFSNIFSAKSNISEVNFVKLFSFVYCLLRENYVRSWIFPVFATSSLWAQKLNQQPAVTYDKGKDGVHSNTPLWLADETSGCFFMGRSRVSSPYHTS